MTQIQEQPAAVPPKIMHLLSGDLWAGAEVMAHTLIRELSHGFGVPVCAVVFNPGELSRRLQADGIDTEVFDESRDSPLTLFRGFRAALERTGAELVHTHRKKENVIGALAARRAGLPSLRTVHGWTEFPNLGLRLDRHLSRLADLWTGQYLQDRVVAVSDELRTKLAAHFDESSLDTVLNGVSIDAARASAAAEAPELPGDPGARRIGIVARLVPVKRHDRFVETAAELLKTRSDIECFIIGDGPGRDDIAQLVEETGVGGRVHMLGFRSDVLNIVAALDALLVTSDHEGLPMNVLEAAAIGTRIVSVPLPSIETVIASGAPGRIAEDATPKALARAVGSVIEAVGSAPPLDDDWAYSARSMAGNYLRLYNEVVAARC